ncbi:MAG: sugar phosphate isomerase/epimerase [Colwellia sp.]|nr:sugar phosphate isomerase/epimerase [Colwellia sp.]
MKFITPLLIGVLMLSTNSFAHNKGINMPQLSVQLWSVKDEVKADFKGTLKQLAEMGFSGVEFANEFGEFSDDAKGIRSVLDELGLKGSGAHISFEQLNDKNFNSTVKFYQTLGVEILIVPWDDRAWHPEGIDEVVSLLNSLSKKLAPLGMKTGFHNHEHEFNDFKGMTYWDYLAKNTFQEVVLQQDVGWTTYAGKDPIEYVKRYPGRTLTTHYKVRLPEGTQGKLPIIGQDTIDWLNLSKANIAVGGTLWFVVEQEEYPNGLTPLEAVKQSKMGLDKILKQL